MYLFTVVLTQFKNPIHRTTVYLIKDEKKKSKIFSNLPDVFRFTYILVLTQPEI